MYTISKQFSFAASHQFRSLPPEHPCSRLHGHNYVVELILQADQLNAHGFVIDFGDLAPFEQYLAQNFDHRHLNDILGDAVSVESIAAHLFHWAQARWPQVTAVRVGENATTWAEYRDA